MALYFYSYFSLLSIVVWLESIANCNTFCILSYGNLSKAFLILFLVAGVPILAAPNKVFSLTGKLSFTVAPSINTIVEGLLPALTPLGLGLTGKNLLPTKPPD